MKQRFDALSREISDPDVIADQNRWRELVKEHSQLEPIIAKYDEYTDTQREIEECKEMLAEAGSDRDMKELAESELRELEKKAEQQIGELKVMLLPKDKNDDRNVIMEIRAGTGGDEAALFGAVLLRMYQRYAERHGFKYELIDINETERGAIGGKRVLELLPYRKGSLCPHEVRKRRTPRAACARDGNTGQDPDQCGYRCGASGSRGCGC